MAILKVTTKDTTLEALLTGSARMQGSLHDRLPDPFQDAIPCCQVTVTLPDGRVFPTLDGTAMSWDIGSAFTLSDEQSGYFKTRRIIRAFRELRPEQLERERRELVKASFDRMFGHNARRLLALIEEADSWHS